MNRENNAVDVIDEAPHWTSFVLVLVAGLALAAACAGWFVPEPCAWFPAAGETACVL